MRTARTQTWVHPHPAAIILYSFKQVLLLLVPIVRALFSFQDGFAAWNDYMWVDLLAIFGMFGIGYMRYLATGYQVRRQGVCYKSGLLFHRRGYIPFREISVLICEKRLWFRPVRYCTVYLDTDAGGSGEADFTINLSYRQADALVKQVQSVCRNPQAVRRVCHASWWEVLFLSFLCSDSLSGILFLSAAISGLGDLVSMDIQALIRENFNQLIRLANLLAINIPPIAAWIAYIMMITWGASFLVHAVGNLRFTVSRQDDELCVHSGIFSHYDHVIKVSKINRIEIRQTLMTKLIGLQSVFVQCCGYGKISNNLSVLLPAGTTHNIEKRLAFLLPEYTFPEREIKPKKAYLGRFLNPPIWIIIGLTVLFTFLIWLLPGLASTLKFIGGASLLPAVWFLVVKIASYYHTGISRSGDHLTLRYTYGYRFLTTTVTAEKISRIQLNQSIFQKFTGGCDVLIYTRAEKHNHIRVPSMNKREAMELFGCC